MTSSVGNVSAEILIIQAMAYIKPIQKITINRSFFWSGIWSSQRIKNGTRSRRQSVTICETLVTRPSWYSSKHLTASGLSTGGGENDALTGLQGMRPGT